MTPSQIRYELKFQTTPSLDLLSSWFWVAIVIYGCVHTTGKDDDKEI